MIILVLFRPIKCYPTWYCHLRITSFCSTASTYRLHIKAWRVFRVKYKWFTQVSSYCVIFGQCGAACISCVTGTTGKPVVNHQPTKVEKLEKAVSNCFSSEFVMSEEHQMMFDQSVLNLGKNTMYTACVSACTHVWLSMCVAHTCLCVQGKWLTVKYVTNSNFNCQWKKALNIYGFCPDELRRRV